QPIPPVPVAPTGQQVVPEILAAHTAWVKGSKEIASLMLMTMEPEIQRNLEPLHAHEMLKELKKLFARQAEHELLQTTRDFHSCRQEERQSVQKGNKHKKSHSQKGVKGQNQGKGKFAPKPKYLAELIKKKKNTASGAGGSGSKG
nr:zinc finger, CCHC-type [Tanacetum cinerariifolium]